MVNTNKKLSFLFISSDKHPPHRVDVSVLFGREMVSRGHSIEWILQSDDACKVSYKTTWSDCQVWVGRTDNGSSRMARLRKHVYSIFHDLRLFSCMRHNHYDVLQVKDKFISALFAIVAARLYKTKFVYWLSFPFPEESLYKYKDGTARYPYIYLVRGLSLKFLLYRIIMPRADFIFVQSEQMKNDVAEMGIDRGKMAAIPMGVSLPIKVQDCNNDLMVFNKTKTVVYIGTLARVRRIDFLVQVIARVIESVPEVALVLVGDGEDQADRDAITNEATKLGISDFVTITGFLPREKALSYVAKADVCVSPFYPTPILNSTSPTKIVEYMALGKPVVANDHPEQRLIIEESEGGLSVPYSEVEFADAVIELLKDPGRATKMGKRGRSYIEVNRSYSKIVQQVESYYLKICQQGY